MTIAERRLVAQRLVGDPFPTPADAVRHLVAVQSQDYPGAKWGLGLRVADATDVSIDRAFDAGEIVRTHVLRPTWHFVAAEDLRWLLALTGPRVHQASGYQYRSLEIDDRLARRAADVFERVLAGGRSLTRPELVQALTAAGITGAALRTAYLVGHAEVEGVLCSGPRRGRAQTYALLEDRLAPAPARSRDEALAELAHRYIEGHGPAQAGDLAWWSGLTLTDARRGLDAAGGALESEIVNGRAFWFAASAPGPAPLDRPIVRLLPNYDELLVAFADRTDAMDAELPPPNRVAAEILNHVIVRDGLVVGRWRRSDTKGTYKVDLDILVSLDSAERQALSIEVERLSAFLGKPVEVTGLD